MISVSSVFAICSSLNVAMYEGPLPMLQGQKGHKDMYSWIQNLCGSTDSRLCGRKRKRCFMIFFMILVKFKVLLFGLWDNITKNKLLLAFNGQSKQLLTFHLRCKIEFIFIFVGLVSVQKLLFSALCYTLATRGFFSRGGRKYGNISLRGTRGVNNNGTAQEKSNYAMAL